MLSSLDDWRATIMADLEKCLPSVGETTTGFHLHHWGHAFAVLVKGWLCSANRQLASQPLGRIFLAGADVEGIPTVDHAMASGFQTAMEVAKFLG